MLSETYPSKRTPIAVYQPPTPFFTQREVHGASARKITPQEFVRRNLVVENLYKTIPLKKGDTVYPIDAKEYEKVGACVVVGVCSSLFDFAPDSKWPKDDNPLLISFYPLSDEQNHFVCTTGYLSKENKHLVTC